jgi:hypothetical protein
VEGWKIGRVEGWMLGRIHSSTRKTIHPSILPTVHPSFLPWLFTLIRATLQAVAGDRWLELVLARGKSEHQRAACLVKARVPWVQTSGNGKCHRK